jgi:hypothetical protein
MCARQIRSTTSLVSVSVCRLIGVSASTLGEHIIIATKDDRLLCVTWHGELLLQRSLRDIDMTPLPADGAAFVADGAHSHSPSVSLNASSVSLAASSSSSSSISATVIAASSAAAAATTTTTLTGSSNALGNSSTVPRSRKSSLDGAPIVGASASTSAAKSAGSHAHAVVQLATSIALRAIALVLADGRVALLRFDLPVAASVPPSSSSSPPPPPPIAMVALSSARGTWLRAIDATLVAFNARHKLLAIGCAR